MSASVRRGGDDAYNVSQSHHHASEKRPSSSLARYSYAASPDVGGEEGGVGPYFDWKAAEWGALDNATCVSAQVSVPQTPSSPPPTPASPLMQTGRVVASEVGTPQMGRGYVDGEIGCGGVGGLHVRHGHHILGATHSLPAASRAPLHTHLESLGATTGLQQLQHVVSQHVVSLGPPGEPRYTERHGARQDGRERRGENRRVQERPSTTGCRSRTGRAHYPRTGPPSSRPATSGGYSPVRSPVASPSPLRPPSATPGPSGRQGGGGWEGDGCAQVWTLSRSPSASAPVASATTPATPSAQALVQEESLGDSSFLSRREREGGGGEAQSEGPEIGEAARAGGSTGEGGDERGWSGEELKSGHVQGAGAEGGGSDSGERGGAARRVGPYVAPVKLDGDPCAVAHKAFPPQPVARVRPASTSSWAQASRSQGRASPGMMLRCPKDRLSELDGARQLQTSFLAPAADTASRAPRTGAAAPPGGKRGAFLNMHLFVRGRTSPRRDALASGSSRTKSGVRPLSAQDVEIWQQSGSLCLSLCMSLSSPLPEPYALSPTP